MGPLPNGRGSENSFNSRFFYFGPRIPQGRGAVEDEFFRRRIGIQAEISDPFELEAVFLFCVFQGGFEFADFENP